MSMDFSVKPVSAPVVAAPLVSSVSVTTDDAVKTQLPAPRTVTAVDAVTYSRNDPRAGDDGVSRQVVIDRAAAMFVYRTIDKRTNEVLTQFPEDAILRRRAYFEALDRKKDGPQPAPTVRDV